MITKTETRNIFDRSKIGVGDIIEFNEYRGGFLGNKVAYRHWAIVQQVEAEVLWILARRDGCVDINHGLGVERAEEIRVIFRHPENV